MSGNLPRLKVNNTIFCHDDIGVLIKFGKRNQELAFYELDYVACGCSIQQLVYDFADISDIVTLFDDALRFDFQPLPNALRNLGVRRFPPHSTVPQEPLPLFRIAPLLRKVLCCALGKMTYIKLVRILSSLKLLNCAFECLYLSRTEELENLIFRKIFILASETLTLCRWSGLVVGHMGHVFRKLLT